MTDKTSTTDFDNDNDDAWLDGPTNKKDPDVGYGRPPRHSQFKKGASGNPKGRPRKSRNAKIIIREVLRTNIEVTLNGKKQSIPVLEAVLRRLAGAAIANNDLKAAQQLVNLAFRVEDDQVTPVDANANPAEDDAVINAFLDRQIAEREARERGANLKRKEKTDD
jgi:hypothetical protein